MRLQSLAWLGLFFACSLCAAEPARIEFSGSHSQATELRAGQTVEISIGIVSPSELPANGRVAIEWSGPAAESGFRKVLHALDPDVYVVYRAPEAGRYTLSLRAIEDEEPAAKAARWRETGVLADVKSFPKLTPWPVGHRVEIIETICVRHIL